MSGIFTFNVGFHLVCFVLFTFNIVVNFFVWYFLQHCYLFSVLYISSLTLLLISLLQGRDGHISGNTRRNLAEQFDKSEILYLRHTPKFYAIKMDTDYD